MTDHNAEGLCQECSTPLPPYDFGRPRRYCSHECTRRAHRRAGKKVARAKAKGAVIVETVDPVRVFERDGWACVFCKKPTPRAKQGSLDHDEPTIDHAVPCFEGGEHSYSNIRLLCRACNQRKGRAESRRAGGRGRDRRWGVVDSH